MALTLRQMAIFEKVALLGSATRAGTALYISQSAVSMALAELEKLCGGELFTRAGRRLLLNERGRLLLPEAQGLLRQAESLERAPRTRLAAGVLVLREATDDPAR